MNPPDPPARSQEALVDALERVVEAHIHVEHARKALHARQENLERALAKAAAVLPYELLGEVLTLGTFVFGIDEDDGTVTVLTSNAQVLP